MLNVTSTSLSKKADIVLPCLRPGSTAFPPPDSALADPPGLLAFGGDLSLPQLLAAYRLGAFPWYSEPDPVLWWHPDPRAVILPADLHIPRSLLKWQRKQQHRVTIDHAFDKVIRHCADGSSLHRERGTWITPAMERAYTQLHSAGHAHSIEVWQDGQLVGGLYGVSMGKVFHGESMFSHCPNASSLALASLLPWLFRQGFTLFDCQVLNPHTARFGATNIPRQAFIQQLAANHDPSPVSDWCCTLREAS